MLKVNTLNLLLNQINNFNPQTENQILCVDPLVSVYLTGEKPLSGSDYRLEVLTMKGEYLVISYG
jgi:hypothetical protein